MSYTEQTMTTTYSAFKKIQANDSEVTYMLSELIDNSLGSIETSNGEYNQLEIHIYLNRLKGTILVEDNAFGMDQVTLEDSIRTDRMPQQGNNFNVYGVGMKNASFWFGEDLEIWSKRTNEKCLYTSVLTSKHKPDEIITWIVSERDDIESRGTKILISNAYKGRIPTTKQFDDNVKPFLEAKYNYYLTNGVKIIFHNKLTNNPYDDYSDYELVPFLIESEIIPDNKIEYFCKRIEEEFADNEQTFIPNLKDIILDLAKSRRPLEFKCSLSYKENNTTPFDFKLGIISSKKNKKFAPYFGISTTQKNRYINLPGTHGNPLKIPKYDYTRTDIKRIWGNVELGEFYPLDNNKKKFDLGEDQDSMNDLLLSMAREMVVISEAVSDVLADEVKPSVEKATPAVVTNINQKLNSEQIKATRDDDGHVIFEAAGKSFRIIEQTYVDGNLDYGLIKCQESITEGVYDIYLNIDHKILKPISGNVKTKEQKETFYPLFLVIAVAGLYNQKANDEDFIPFSVESKKDFFKLIDEILKKYIKS